MWKETQYCFPREIWDIIKEYWGFIPNFPADFGVMYDRFRENHTSGKVSQTVLDCNNNRLKRELGTLYFAPWFDLKFRGFMGTCAYENVSPVLLQLFKENHSNAEWLARKGYQIMDVYHEISRPCNFLQCPFKVGDKVKISVGSVRGILFKQGGDKDNVVPDEDCWKNAGSNKNEKGKSRFYPLYKSTNGGEYEDFVPAIVKSVSALKVKLEYYKYIKTDSVQTSEYYCNETYTADWSEPRGKIVVGWGNKSALPLRSKDMKDVDIYKTNTYYGPR
jgi:hypothetical protein